MKATSCDYCANYVYDEESENYYWMRTSIIVLSVQNIKNARIIAMEMNTE